MRQENPADAKQLAGHFPKKGSVEHAEEANAYNPLHAYYDTQRVDHQIE